MVLSAIEEQELHYLLNSIYECKNKEQLMKKYMHASLGSHPKTTLIAAANTDYPKGFPGMTASSTSKFIAIEDDTKIGHMKQIQQGQRAPITPSTHGITLKLGHGRCILNT